MAAAVATVAAEVIVRAATGKIFYKIKKDGKYVFLVYVERS